MIPIKKWSEQLITVDEFKLRTVGNMTSPAHRIGEVVQFKGDYQNLVYAVIVEVSLRVGGWYYQGETLLPRGKERVSFSEKDIIKGESEIINAVEVE